MCCFHLFELKQLRQKWQYLTPVFPSDVLLHVVLRTVPSTGDMNQMGFDKECTAKKSQPRNSMSIGESSLVSRDRWLNFMSV